MRGVDKGWKRTQKELHRNEYNWNTSKSVMGELEENEKHLEFTERIKRKDDSERGEYVRRAYERKRTEIEGKEK